jgi:hypothetical protein
VLNRNEKTKSGQDKNPVHLMKEVFDMLSYQVLDIIKTDLVCKRA